MMTNNKLYKPRDIAKLGLIRNSKQSDKENSNYFFILNLIKRGQLKAKNYGTKSRPYWLVTDTEIERYQQEMYN